MALGQKARRHHHWLPFLVPPLADKVFVMSRPLIIIAVLLVALLGGAAALAGLNSEKPLTRVEKVVPLASLQK
ncbi:MAG: hypothetical protein BVN32_07910 [Proteobacteria bacterium ST_bin14]|nr:MAG: hypothetical protein BVN32_07910 [Proteobacteria bacterium ST_bin14]